MINEQSTLSEIQSIIDSWIKEHGGYWAPLSMFAAVMEEMGELAREINYREGYKPKKKRDEIINMGEECADILFALICIVNYYNIDLSESLINTLKKYSERDKNRFKQKK